MGTKNQSTPSKRLLRVGVYSVFVYLSRQFFEQLPAGAVMLYFCMQLVDVVAHGNQQKLCENLFVSTKQKLPEGIILLYHFERSLRLNRTVHPMQYAFFTCYALQGFLALFYEFL